MKIYQNQFYMGTMGTLSFKASDDLFVMFSPYKEHNANNKCTYDYAKTITVSIRPEECTLLSKALRNFVDDSIHNPSEAENKFKSFCAGYWSIAEPKRMQNQNLLFVRDDKRVGVDIYKGTLSFKSLPNKDGPQEKKFQITLPFSELLSIADYLDFMVQKLFENLSFVPKPKESNYVPRY